MGVPRERLEDAARDLVGARPTPSSHLYVCGPAPFMGVIERVAAGATEAGRDPSEVEIWFTTRSSLDADRAKAIERIHASVSSILNHSMRFGLDGKNVPTQFRAKIAEYVEGYELYDHVLQAGRNPKRMAELGLALAHAVKRKLCGAPP